MYRALLVCNSRFPESGGELAELHGPKKDGMLLRDALTDHDTGMFNRDDVHLVVEGSSTEIVKEIERFFTSAEPDDTLLFYYSGHGKVLNQQFFLAARDTSTRTLFSTAIVKSVLDGIITSSFAKAKILILDCCNSALAKGGDLAEKLSGRGRFVITATSVSDSADDSKMRGQPSPFTERLVEALLAKAVDRDGDGNVDLDDVYHYLENVRSGGPRPERHFDGAGTIAIARRLAATAPINSGAAAQELAHQAAQSGQPYLETGVPGASFNADRVAEFRALMRDDKLESMPKQLSSREFLHRAGALRGEELTYTGILMFGDNPTQFLPTALVQCVRFSGTAKTDPLQSIELQGTVPELIVKTRDFVAEASRLGETASAEGAYAEPVYNFPMVAVREIIANAIVHRSYEEQESGVQIHLYSDRLEVISPGVWGGSPAVEDGERLLGQLERQSRRLNFRLAQLLTWSKLVEGVGAGVPRAVADCKAVGAPEPSVVTDDRSVTVTIYPRLIKSALGYLAGGSGPMYRQIAEDLRERIEAGDLRPGEQLPTEQELRKNHGASRNTIRDAIRWLTALGLVETRPGQGTFVVQKISPFVTTLSGEPRAGALEHATYLSEVSDQKRKASSSPVQVEIREASGDVASALRLPEGTEVISRHERRFIDGTPWSMQTSFYPMEFADRGAERLRSTRDIEEGTVQYLADTLHIKQVGYRDWITVRAPNPAEADFFRLPPDGRVAVFEIYRSARDQNGDPMRLTVSVFPSDRNQFIVAVGEQSQ